MGQNQMIILSVISESELLKELFLNYQLLVRKAVNETNFTERVQIIRKMNYEKEKLQNLIAEIQLSSNSVIELESKPYEMIDDKVLQGKLKTGLYRSEDLRLLLKEHGALLQIELKKIVSTFFNKLKANEYLLFWYIEESEWRALLSN